MFTALVTPEYAERHSQAVAVAGGFIAHGLVPPQRDGRDGALRFHALLPGAPGSEAEAEVTPIPADEMRGILETERDRYLDMAGRDRDQVWRNAADAIDDMLRCLRRHQRAEQTRIHAEPRTEGA